MNITHQTTFNALTIGAMRDDYCVYVHELMPDANAKKGDVFYAGVCKLMDVFKFPDAYKNTHWRDTINDNSIIKLSVIMTSHAPMHCHNYLATFVKMVRPTANIKGYQAAGKAIITCLEGPNAGKTYETQERAALENGLAQPTMSNHLNGRPGYERIRGMKFKRGM